VRTFGYGQVYPPAAAPCALPQKWTELNWFEQQLVQGEEMPATVPE
jgi:hypothetical protein